MIAHWKWRSEVGDKDKDVYNLIKKQSWDKNKLSTQARAGIHSSNKVFVPSLAQCPEGLSVWWLRRSHAGVVCNTDNGGGRVLCFNLFPLCNEICWRISLVIYQQIILIEINMGLQSVHYRLYSQVCFLLVQQLFDKLLVLSLSRFCCTDGSWDLPSFQIWDEPLVSLILCMFAI